MPLTGQTALAMMRRANLTLGEFVVVNGASGGRKLNLFSKAEKIRVYPLPLLFSGTLIAPEPSTCMWLNPCLQPRDQRRTCSPSESLN